MNQLDPHEPLKLRTERAWYCEGCKETSWDAIGQWDGITLCIECDRVVARCHAFLCPVDSDNCDALVNEQQVKTHLVEDHAGEYPALWINSSGDLVVDED